jgi:D-glucosaminate-6-phosphate ammonia-lyase
MTSNVFQSLGITPLINACGTMTRFGGGIMRPEVADAMREATQHCVDIPTLQARASVVIAEVTGAEAGFVTSGAAAAVLLGTAACVTGLNAAKMDRLPDTRGMRNEVIVARSQRNAYDHAVRATGVTLVEVGLSDRFAGTGSRDAEAWEIAGAINEQTAAVFHLAKPHSRPRLTEVAAVAHAAGIPVVVDAAAELPPVANLRQFIAEGADLVAFSGGKMIGGPQGSGILCGRRELIGAALLQQLDLDYVPGEWDPPGSLIDRGALSGLPRNGLGRTCKVGKEQIVGLLTALRIFAAEGDGGRHERSLAVASRLVTGLAEIASIATAIVEDPDQGGLPSVELRLDARRPDISAADLVQRLRGGSPRIEVNSSRLAAGAIVLSTACLRDEDPTAIISRLTEILR